MNEETWKKYSETIKQKLIVLSEAVEKNKIQLSSEKDVVNYLFNFPGDYGGLGEISDDQNYEQVNFYEHKATKGKIVPIIRIDQGQVYVPIEFKQENINNINNSANNFPALNTNITGSQLGSAPPNQFLVYPPVRPELYPFLYPRPGYPYVGLDQAMNETMNQEPSEGSQRSRKKRSRKMSSSSEDSRSSSESSRRQRREKKKRSHHRSKDKEKSRKEKRRHSGSHSHHRSSTKKGRNKKK